MARPDKAAAGLAPEGANRRRGLPLASALVLCLLPVQARGQGDSGALAGEGRTWIAVNATAVRVESVAAAEGDLRAELDLSFLDLSVGHGLSEVLDVVGRVTLARSDPDLELGLEEDQGLQDAFVGLRWRLAAQDLGGARLSWVLVPGVTLPVRDYPTDSVASVGSGETTVQASLVARVDWDGGIFAAAELGLRDDLGSTSDAVVVGVSGGAPLGGRWFVSPFAYRWIGTGGEELTSLGGGGGGMGQGGQPRFSIAELDAELLVAGLGLFADLGEGLGLSLGLFTTLEAENALESDGLSVGLVWSPGS